MSLLYIAAGLAVLGLIAASYAGYQWYRILQLKRRDRARWTRV